MMEGQTPVQQQQYTVLITANGAEARFTYRRPVDASIKVHSLMTVFGTFDYTYDVLSRTYLIEW